MIWDVGCTCTGVFRGGRAGNKPCPPNIAKTYYNNIYENRTIISVHSRFLEYITVKFLQGKIMHAIMYMPRTLRLNWKVDNFNVVNIEASESQQMNP